MSDNKRDLLIYPVSVVVLLGWASALVYALISGEYVPLTVTTPVMLPLAGWVFGVSLVKKGSGSGDD